MIFQDLLVKTVDIKNKPYITISKYVAAIAYPLFNVFIYIYSNYNLIHRLT